LKKVGAAWGQTALATKKGLERLVKVLDISFMGDSYASKKLPKPFLCKSSSRS